MKKATILILLICLCLIGSFVFLFFEYSKYSDTNNKYITLQKEVDEIHDKLRIVSDDKAKLKLEEETINNEKKIQIEQYQKWERQNQILKDLIK